VSRFETLARTQHKKALISSYQAQLMTSSPGHWDGITHVPLNQFCRACHPPQMISHRSDSAMSFEPGQDTERTVLLRKDTKKIISVLLHKSCSCELFLVYVQQVLR